MVLDSSLTENMGGKVHEDTLPQSIRQRATEEDAFFWLSHPCAHKLTYKQTDTSKGEQAHKQTAREMAQQV